MNTGTESRSNQGSLCPGWLFSAAELGAACGPMVCGSQRSSSPAGLLRPPHPVTATKLCRCQQRMSCSPAIIQYSYSWPWPSLCLVIHDTLTTCSSGSIKIRCLRVSCQARKVPVSRGLQRRNRSQSCLLTASVLPASFVTSAAMPCGSWAGSAGFPGSAHPRFLPD